MSKKYFGFVLVTVFLLLGGLSAIAQDSQQADDAFARLDTNKDAKLNQTEFDRLFAMRGETSVSAQEKQSEFKAWDADGDGSISKAEFSAKYQPASSPSKSQQ